MMHATHAHVMNLICPSAPPPWSYLIDPTPAIKMLLLLFEEGILVLSIDDKTYLMNSTTRFYVRERFHDGNSERSRHIKPESDLEFCKQVNLGIQPVYTLLLFALRKVSETIVPRGHKYCLHDFTLLSSFSLLFQYPGSLLFQPLLCTLLC